MLVNIIAKTIERIALLGIEKALTAILKKDEKGKTDEIDQQNEN